MRRLLNFLFLILLASCTSFFSQEKPKKRIAPPKLNVVRNKIMTLPVEDLSSLKLSVPATSVLKSTLQRISNVQLVDSEKLTELAWRMYSTRTFNESIVLLEARKLGAQALIYPKILRASYVPSGDGVGFFGKSQAQVSIDFQIVMYEVNSMEKILNIHRNYQDVVSDGSWFGIGGEKNEEKKVRNVAIDKLADMMDMVGRDISFQSAKLSWEGRIAQIEGPNIYINAGRSSGIEIGDILKVSMPGEEIFDPETGALIGRTKGRVKATVEVVDFIGSDGSKCLLHSGSSVSKQDRVTLY